MLRGALRVGRTRLLSSTICLTFILHRTAGKSFSWFPPVQVYLVQGSGLWFLVQGSGLWFRLQGFAFWFLVQGFDIWFRVQGLGSGFRACVQRRHALELREFRRQLRQAVVPERERFDLQTGGRFNK